MRTAELWGANAELTHEVAERQRAENDLKSAKDAAEAASRVKSEFLANMSHEIRTPMNGIIGMTELALETGLTRQQREYLGLVKSSAESLLTVINDILDFSKIEAGKLSLDLAPFALRDVVGETLHTLAMRAHAKGLELACRVGPDIPDCVIGDAGRLRQVVVNLVGNAIKFTEQGEIVVDVALEDAGDRGIGLRFSVADTGVGIPRQKLEMIFQPFEQADGSTTRRFGGTGLGLAISAKLVGMMDGRIWVDSEPGRGSTFWFTVVFGGSTPDLAGRVEPPLPRLDGLRVLIVDDNATNRLILQEVLSNWGACPVVVDGGVAALLRATGGRGTRPAISRRIDRWHDARNGRTRPRAAYSERAGDCRCPPVAADLRRPARRHGTVSVTQYRRLPHQTSAAVRIVRCPDESHGAFEMVA